MGDHNETTMSFVGPLLRGPVAFSLKRAAARAHMTQRSVWVATRATVGRPDSAIPVILRGIRSCRPTGASVRSCSSNARSKAKEAAQESQTQNNTNVALWGCTAAIATLAAAYLSVPLYRMFCQAYGYDLASQEESQQRLKELTPDERCAEREMMIRFDAGTNDRMQWKFKPLQRAVTVIPGKSSLAFYNAKNNAETPVVGMATYSVTPVQAGKHFKKVQCFCFEEQRLQVGEDVDMPVLFYMDPELLDDKEMKDVNDVTLSYTFFEATDSAGIDASVKAGATLGTTVPRTPARSAY